MYGQAGLSEYSPVYKPPSSPSSVLPPGKATCASFVTFLLLSGGVSCSTEGLSRRRKRISGRAAGSFTQSKLKNSERVGGGTELEGMELPGAGATRMMSATAARRGSVGVRRRVSRSCHNECDMEHTSWRRGDYPWRSFANTMKSSSEQGYDRGLFFCEN